MKFIKTFENFKINEASPTVEPDVKPDVKPEKPKIKPRPSPIRREKPSEKPKPKANLKKATAEEVSERFLSELKKSGADIKNYVK